jgi:tetratricopeptide (TPR) repeat protein
MREPDRFQVVASQAAAWLAARKKLAMTAGGVAVAVILVGGIVLAVASQRAEVSGKDTAALLALAASPVVDTPAAGAVDKTFPSDEAKNRALLAEADKVLAAHGVGRSTLLAVLVKANAHLALKEWDAAGAQYARYLAEAPASDSLRFTALENLGILAEQKGDLAGAAQAYERMAKDAPLYADRADLDRARVLSAAGKKDEARPLLAKFSENHPKSTLQREAAQQLQLLGAK